jgi:MFS family permease
MHGVYLLWWVQERHVAVSIVAGVLASGDLALAALEWPTGWFADRFGHRASLIVGSVLQTVGMLLCWLAAGVPGLLAASVVVAAGDAFRSGADQALLYRSCVAAGREDRFLRIEAGTYSLQLVALVSLTLVGGFITGRLGFALGWTLEVALSLAGLAIACAFVEPPAVAFLPGDAEGEDGTERDRARFSRRCSYRMWPLIVLTLPAALVAAVTQVSTFAAQVAGTDAGRVAVLVAALALAEAGGAALAMRCTPATRRTQFAILAMAAGCVAVGLSLPMLFVPALVGLSTLLGAAVPLRAAATQRLADDAMRARASSLASACDKAFTTMALALFGFWRRRRG